MLVEVNETAFQILMPVVTTIAAMTTTIAAMTTHAAVTSVTGASCRAWVFHAVMSVVQWVHPNHGTNVAARPHRCNYTRSASRGGAVTCAAV